MILDIPISILIDSGTSYSYINPNLVAKCRLSKYQMVQLATGVNRKITSMIKGYSLILNGLRTFVDLDVIPLGSYYLLIGIWLDENHSLLDFRN
jgi:hypothetical protein